MKCIVHYSKTVYWLYDSCKSCIQRQVMKGWRLMGSKCLRYTALTIAIIGAVNWGLIGFFNLNLVALLFGSMSWISRIVYGLVGICGLYLLTFYGDSDTISEQS